MRRAVAIVGLLVAAGGLILQLGLTIQAFVALELPLASALIFNFAYFTVLVNWFICACYVAAIWPRLGWLDWLRRHEVVSFAVPAILLVVLVALLILDTMVIPPGLFRIAEFDLHYVAPPIFLAWWAVFQADGSLRLAIIPAWLLPPLIYLGFVFMRGATVEVYPYPFLDIVDFGLSRVLIYLGAIVVAFVGLCVFTVFADRWIGSLRGVERRSA